MKLFRGARSLATAVDLYGGELRSATGLRVAAVFVALVVLSFESTDSFSSIAESPLWALGTYAYATLFALTGYLLAGSLDRHDRRHVVVRRLRRAYPAVLLSTMACFALLGPLVSGVGLRRYFGDGEGWQFLLNLVAVPQLTLPGVFEFNALSDIVNAHLWAPASYVVVVAFGMVATRLQRRRALVLAGFAALLTVGPLALDGLDVLPGSRIDPVRLMLAGPGLSAVLSGIAGIAAAWWAGRIPLARVLLAISAAAMAGTALFGDDGWRGAPAFHIAIAVPATYVALYLATKRLPFSRIAASLYGPSAGLFFFAPPLQQLAASTGLGGSSGVINAVLAVPAALLASVASWWLIERRLTAGQRATHPAFAAQVRLPQPRSMQSWRERMERGAITIAVGLVLALLMTAVMAITFYAMQKPVEGM